MRSNNFPSKARASSWLVFRRPLISMIKDMFCWMSADGISGTGFLMSKESPDSEELPDSRRGVLLSCEGVSSAVVFSTERALLRGIIDSVGWIAILTLVSSKSLCVWRSEFESVLLGKFDLQSCKRSFSETVTSVR